MSDVDKMSFEDAIKELETVVGQLERGDVALDESIALYERGAALNVRAAPRGRRVSRFGAGDILPRSAPRYTRVPADAHMHPQSRRASCATCSQSAPQRAAHCVTVPRVLTRATRRDTPRSRNFD